jgi:cell division transport system permease protein
MFKRILFEGAKNIVRSFWLSATAVLVLTVSLSSVALIATLSTTVSFSVQNLDETVTVRGLIAENFPDDRVSELTEAVQKLDGAKSDSLIYLNKEEASKEIIENNRGNLSQDFIDNYSEGDSFAFRVIEISPDNLEDYNLVIQNMEEIKLEGVENVWEAVVRDKIFVENLRNLNHWVRIIGIVLILVFACISILVMANILRITIYSHKEEIEIMRLVGATNNYIRLPFVAEGIYYNVIAAIIVVALFIPSLNTILPQMQNWISDGNFIGDASGLSFQIYITIATTIITGILVGIITTYLTIQRYLQL